MRVGKLFPLLLLVTLVASAYYLLDFVPKHSNPGEPVFALADYFLTYAPIQGVKEAAYVVPDSLQAWNTPAEIRTQVAALQSGEQVRILGHFRDWIHVRMLDGHEGWVSDDGLMNAETHEEEERLSKDISDMPPQARGHSADLDNVHIEPSRQAAVVAQVKPEQSLKIFGRRMVRRFHGKSGADSQPVSSARLEAWYLIQQGSHVGWILGHRVRLDIPKRISAYAQETNLVAWLVLDTVDDNGHQIPQYLVADRVGTQAYDFTDIRVLTWWKKKQTYSIAYREGGLRGYFPILVTHEGSVPYFRLRLVDDAGNKCQRIYGLFETITRRMRTAGTWGSDVTTEQTTSRAQKRWARPAVTMHG